MAGTSDYEPDEVVFEEDDGLEGPSDSPRFIRIMGRIFRLWRREVVSRGGERTHLRLTYRATTLPFASEQEDREPLGGRSGGLKRPQDG